MSAGRRIEDYERVFEWIAGRKGSTEREIVGALILNTYRFREIVGWLVAKELVIERRIGERADPHDGDRTIPIMLYTRVPGAGQRDLHKRFKSDEEARARGGRKLYDATALLAAWWR